MTFVLAWLFWSVANKHAFLNLKNKICKSWHLCSTTVLHSNAVRPLSKKLQVEPGSRWVISLSEVDFKQNTDLDIFGTVNP